jgi:hypothetical protein
MCLISFAFLIRPCLASGPPPVITVQPVSLNVPLLGIASFSVTASSTTTLNYQWFKDGKAITGATSSTYTILSVLGSSSGTYAVQVSNAGGSVMSANATLNLGVAPSITTQPVSQAVPQGQNASFSVSASGTSPLTYQWYFNNSTLSGASGSSLALKNVSAAQAGGYYVVIVNAAGSVTSAVATLTVYVPPVIQTQPASLSLVQGQTASFSVAVNGSAPLKYQWRFNGSPLDGATNSTLTITNVQAAQAGNYTLKVVNNVGSATSAAATLAVTTAVVSLSSPSAAVTSSGGFNFGLSVPVGLTYVIQASSDCQNWTPIATNVTTTGNAVYTDPEATNYIHRFYRAVLP